jgi:hypothetical protein
MRLRSTLLLPALLALGACGDDGGTTPPPPPGGTFDAVVVSPNGEEASAVIEITGTGIEQVIRATGFLAASPVNGGQRLVIVREVPGALEFAVKVAAGNEPPTAHVIEVAGADDLPRASTSGYSVTFTRREEP